MKFSKEAKIGILAVVSFTIFYLGFNFLKGRNFFSNTKTYYVIYPKTGGLKPSNPVQINDVTVGRVNYIQLLPKKNNSVLVEIEVDNAIELGDSTWALLSKVDLLGATRILLIPGNSSKLYKSGDTLRSGQEKDFLQTLSEKANPILEEIDTTLVRFNRVLEDETNNQIKKILANLVATTENLNAITKQNRENLNSITTNLNALSASLLQTSNNLKPLLAKFNDVADSLKNTELKQAVRAATNAMNDLNSITSKINRGEGSVGDLINNKQTVDNLNRTLKSLNDLLVDLKYNPRHYFKPFGEKPKKKNKIKTDTSVATK
ncbi:MAG: MlaD family protein [Cytophagaceae bacterium]|nr:MlaD family protein [Cytophagaceae bacterium]MDW8455378.1 MlaD family protein [Cytophagaceae bacterium]